MIDRRKSDRVKLANIIQQKEEQKTMLKSALEEINIHHKLIRPYTPHHPMRPLRWAFAYRKSSCLLSNMIDEIKSF